MNSFPMKYLILVIDNVEFYYTYIQEIKETCYVKGIIIICLLLYSLDFNSIKEFFSTFKAFIKRTHKKKTP